MYVTALALQEAENSPWNVVACGVGLNWQCKVILCWLVES